MTLQEGRFARFVVRGVTLDIPKSALTEDLAQSLVLGKYERFEARALRDHLRPGDRFLDLGAGAGFLCALASGLVGAERVMGVEANPTMVAAARSNLVLNGAGAAVIHHGAVVATDLAAPVRFFARKPFWAGGVVAEGDPAHRRHVEVPGLPLRGLLSEHAPSVVCMDIEGGEVGFAGFSWPPEVRLLILEIHPKLYPPETVHGLLSGLFAEGFTYCPRGSRAETLVLERVAPRKT